MAYSSWARARPIKLDKDVGNRKGRRDRVFDLHHGWICKLEDQGFNLALAATIGVDIDIKSQYREEISMLSKLKSPIKRRDGRFEHLYHHQSNWMATFSRPHHHSYVLPSRALVKYHISWSSASSSPRLDYCLRQQRRKNFYILTFRNWLCFTERQYPYSICRNLPLK